MYLSLSKTHHYVFLQVFRINKMDYTVPSLKSQGQCRPMSNMIIYKITVVSRYFVTWDGILKEILGPGLNPRS